MTLVVEVKGAFGEGEPFVPTEVTIAQSGTRQSGAKQKATSLAVTIPHPPSTNRGSSTNVTIPQRPRHEAEARRAGKASASEAEAASENEAPWTGKYTLVREIARGGMGQIYFGEDPQLERQVEVNVSRVAYGGR